MIEGQKFNIATQKPLILLAPLDWGLGHTTRCIPLIRDLHSLGWQVVVACNSDQKAVLEAECPHITFLFLKGYDVFYGTNRAMTWLGVLFQVPKILIRIKKEHKWLRKWAQQAPVRAIISDNRYGLHLAGVPSVFITHQLLVKTGAGRFCDQLLQKLHYRLIQRFTACWVPDQEGSVNAAGELSHPAAKPAIPLDYIGCVSRLEPCPLANAYEYDLLIILSGPEPQRTLFEQLLVAQLKNFSGRAVLVTGVPANGALPQIPAHVSLHHRISSVELNELICRSRMVICRSGYSTVMDLLKLNRKMIVVPTPGQTEQEYLAKWLHRNKLAYGVTQKKFFLQQTLQEAEKFDWTRMQWNMDQYHEVIAAFTKKVLGT